MLLYNARYSVQSHANDGQAQGEEQNQLNLSLDRHITLDDDGNREYNEHQVGQYVACGHRDELSVALTALAARIWQDLPVVAEGSAFD